MTYEIEIDNRQTITARIKAEWGLTDISAQTLGFWRQGIFYDLCCGKGIEEIARSIHYEQEMQADLHHVVPEFKTEFELEFHRRFLEQIAIGQMVVRLKELQAGGEA